MPNPRIIPALLSILTLLTPSFAATTTSIPKASIPPALFTQLETTANIAKVAYCTVNPFFSTGSLATECDTMEFCRKQDTMEIVQVFRPEWIGRTLSGSGFVSKDDTKKEVYVAFRGTCSPGDWMTDFTAVQASYMPVMALMKNETAKTQDWGTQLDVLEGIQKGNGSEVMAMDALKDDLEESMRRAGQDKLCHNCKVHLGVYLAHKRLFPYVIEAVKPYLDNRYKLTVTGHSLGGGYAQLAGMEFQYLGYNPRVVSYGQLRVGNPEMNEYADKIFHTEQCVKVVEEKGKLPHGSFSRVYQSSDVVPQLPPFRKYTHAGMAFNLKQISLPQNAEVIEFKGKTDNWKNADFEFELGELRAYFILHQHINYFTRLSWPCNDLPLPNPRDALEWPFDSSMVQ